MSDRVPPHSSESRATPGRRVVALRIGLPLVALAYAFAGFREIAPGEVGLVYRFGRLVVDAEQNPLRSPGLVAAWPPPIDRVVRVSVKRECVLEIDSFWAPSDRTMPKAGSAQGDESAAEGKATEEVAADASAGDDAGNEPVDPIADGAADGTAGARSSASPPTSFLSSDSPGGAERHEVLTGDGCLLGVRLTAKYLVASPRDYVRCGDVADSLCRVAVVQELRRAVNGLTLDEALQTRVDGARVEALLGSTSADETGAAGRNLSDIVRTRAQRTLDELACGLTLTSVQIAAPQPPREVRAAFAALQRARVEQETTRDRMLAAAHETVQDASSLAAQSVAEARGRAELRQAEVASLLNLYAADRASLAVVGPAATRTRLRRETWESIGASGPRTYFVPVSNARGSYRLVLPHPDAQGDVR